MTPLVVVLVQAAPSAPAATSLRDVLLTTLGTVVAALVSWGGAELIRLIRSRTQAGLVQDALLHLERAAEVGVNVAFETFTKQLKAQQGVLSKDQAHEAAELAWQAALATLATEGRRLVERGLSDGWQGALRTMLEHKYADLQAGKDPAPVPLPSLPPPVV